MMFANLLAASLLVSYSLCSVVPHAKRDTSLTFCPTSEIPTVTGSQIFVSCPNSDYHTGSINIINNIATDDACAQQCGSQNGCAQAVRDKSYQICHIKPANSGYAWTTSSTGQYDSIRALPAPVKISQCQGLISSVSGFTICPNSDYHVGSTQVINSIASVAQCAQQCASIAGCQKGVYDKIYKICHIKGTNPGVEVFYAASQYDSFQTTTASVTSIQSASATSSASTLTSTTAVSTATASAVSFQKPVMGYNTYNYIACSPSQRAIQGQVDALASQGYVRAGYRVFQIDCGWQAQDGSRNATTGGLAVNINAFPAGMSAMSNYITQKGLFFGMYSDAGVRSCDTQVPSPLAGSVGYELADARQFKAWNTSYLKYDNCYADSPTDNAPKAPRTDFPSRFSAMTSALKSVGIPGMLTCQWGTPFLTPQNTLQGPVSWTQGVSTSFRLSDDIYDGWNAVTRIINQAQYVAGTGLTGPGFHADADLLEVGNSGMTFAQQQTHFAYWAMVKSALMISTDVTQASAATKALLQNSGLIQINQDDLGKPIQLIQRFTNDYDIHAGPLANGDMAVLAINWQSSARSLTLSFSSFGVTRADVTDLLTGQQVTGASSYTSNTDANAPIALRLSNVVLSSTTQPQVRWYEAESGQVAGTASVAPCSGCSGGKKVGMLGRGTGNTVVLSGITATQATSTLLFDYVNCDVSYMYSGINERTAVISVNNGPSLTVSFPLTGYNWDADVKHNYRVQLTGFVPGAANTVTIGGPISDFGPDLDRVGVLQ